MRGEHTLDTTPTCRKKCSVLEKVSLEQLSAENTLPWPTKFFANHRLRSSKAAVGVPFGFVCCNIDAVIVNTVAMKVVYLLPNSSLREATRCGSRT